MTKEHYAFGEGMPTGPDVTLIRKTYPELQVGDRIEYSAISELLGVPADSSRFKSITTAWRKRELEERRVINCEPGVAFVVASFDQITDGTVSMFRHVSRKARRQWKKLATTAPVDEREQSIKEHQMRLCAMTDKDARKSRSIALPSLESANQVRLPMRPMK